MSEVLAGKLKALSRSLKRIQETWQKPSVLSFEEDQDKQDIIVLNLQHFFEDLSDCCRYLLRIRELGWANNNAEAFDLLEQTGLINSETKTALKKANGMRNIMVHRYLEIDLDIVTRVVEHEIEPLYAKARALVFLELKSPGPEKLVTEENEDNQGKMLNPG